MHRNFEIAEDDGVFYATDAQIGKGRVVLNFPKVERPAATRYVAL